MTKIFFIVNKFLAREDGPTIAEYGLLVAVIAVVASVGAATLGIDLRDVFTAVGNKVSGYAP
jgi:Flp pilus assembly pilin Flp